MTEWVGIFNQHNAVLLVLYASARGTSMCLFMKACVKICSEELELLWSNFKVNLLSAFGLNPLAALNYSVWQP